MNFSRFDLTPTEQRRVNQFRDLIWRNSETCNECFSRVREVERNPAAENLAETSVRNIPAEYHERTEYGSSEWCGWDNTARYGTVFCLECGSDLSAQTQSKSMEDLIPVAKNLLEYTNRHTDVKVSGKRMGQEIRELKTQPEFQCRDTQILAVAWARALVSQVGTSEKAPA